MIRVTYSAKSYSLHVQGHDHQDDGNRQSLLCNAASTLFYALCYNVSKRAMEMENLIGHKVRAEKGDAYIEISPESYARLGYTAMFEHFVNGFKMLAEEHPERIEVIEE